MYFQAMRRRLAEMEALAPHSTNPYVFIVGCPRSGTTLLQRMVNAHPQIAITPETHWIPRLYKKRSGLTVEGLVTPELISHLLELPKFTRLGIGREELVELMGEGQSVSYSTFVTGIFDLFGKGQGKALVGDKTPGYARNVGILNALWPRARFIHLIRDGRDVCLSIANWPKAHQKRPGKFATWKEDPVSTTAFWWDFMVRVGREEGESLGPELYYEIRYESLVENPAEECTRLCGFLGLPYDGAMLRFHEGRTKESPSLDAKHAWLPVTRGLREWQSQMPPDDVERFEGVAGELLNELGYPRAFPHTRPGMLEGVARIRNLLKEDPGWQETQGGNGNA
jgi:hypothetical protein